MYSRLDPGTATAEIQHRPCAGCPHLYKMEGTHEMLPTPLCPSAA